MLTTLVISETKLSQLKQKIQVDDQLYKLLSGYKL